MGQTTRAVQALSQQVMELTRAFVHDFYDNRGTLVEQVLADDFVWLGAQPDQYTHGKAEFMQTYAAIMREAAHVRIFDLTYTLDALEPAERPRIALATVSYFGSTDPTRGQIFADQQRCTFVWRVLPPRTRLARRTGRPRRPSGTSSSSTSTRQTPCSRPSFPSTFPSAPAWRPTAT